MIRKLFAVLLSTATLSFCTPAMAADAGETVVPVVSVSEPRPFIPNPENNLDRLFNSTGQLLRAGESICSVGQVSKTTFLTAKHCIQDLGERRSYRVLLNNKISESVVRVETSMTGSEDWAVLHTETRRQTFDPSSHSLEADCEYTPKLGDKVAYMGYPTPASDKVLGMGYVASTAPTENKETGADFLLDLEANHRASGSPIISQNSGKIIGVLVEGVPQSGGGFYLIGAQSMKETSLCQ